MATLKILESVRVGNSMAIVAEVSEGGVHSGDILVDQNSGSFKWRVIGLGFSPPNAHRTGRVALSVQPLDNPSEITVGQLLMVQ